MRKVATILKKFHSYTDVLYYLLEVEYDMEVAQVYYTDEVYYSEVFQQYKVIVKVYAIR